MPKFASTPTFSFYAVLNKSQDGPTEYNGATMVFLQDTAPVGWTKDTSNDDYTLRVVSGAASSGGSQGFTTVFTDQPTSGTIPAGVGFSVGFTTLSSLDLPVHSHPGSGYTISSISLSVGSGFSARTPQSTTNTGNAGQPAAAGGGNHTHTQPISSVADTFSGNPINMSIRYVDAILATYPT